MHILRPQKNRTIRFAIMYGLICRLYMSEMKLHADKFNAKTFYAGVGLGSAEDYGKPVEKGDSYTVIYNGLQEIE